MSRAGAPSYVKADDAEEETADLTPQNIDELADKAQADAAEAAERAAHARARADALKQAAKVPARERMRWRIGRPRWRYAAVIAALLCAAALFGASALMVKQQHEAQANDRLKAEYTAAARQVVVTLMSIDTNDPQGSVQRILDNSTGEFRSEFEGAAADFIRMAEDAKVTTKATATAAAVETMTADSAVVLVSASSTVSNTEGADEAPRNWRLTVDLQRDGDQIKMAKVEFVP